MADRELFIHTETNDNVGGDPYIASIGVADHAYLLTMAGMAEGPDLGYHIDHLRSLVESNDIDWEDVTHVDMTCKYKGREHMTSVFCRPVGT